MKDIKVLLTDFHYKKEFTPVEKITAGVLYTVLGLPSAVYWAVAKTRNFLYKKRILKSYKSPLYTISVGNITTGGTGKTPITAEIANYLAKKGGFPAILSRGYGGKLNNKNVNVISDGLTINHTAIEAGDEPFWLSKHCKNTAVLTCSSRVKSAKFAKENLNCTALILDDGFQHLKLQRDLNILVVDSEKKFSNGCMLPLGALREPLSSIKRADKIVVVNKSFNDKKAKAYARFLRKKYSIPVFVCSMVPDEIYNIKTNEKLSDSAAVIAFSAIGQPEQFYKFLRGYDVVGTQDFPDHHIYTKEDLDTLYKLKEKYVAQALITTEKDAVKLKEIAPENTDIYALKLKPVLDLKGLLESDEQ